MGIGGEECEVASPTAMFTNSSNAKLPRACVRHWAPVARKSGHSVYDVRSLDNVAVYNLLIKQGDSE